MAGHREDPAVTSARIEAIVVALIFLAAMTYTGAFCYVRGYNRPPETLTWIVGFPDWIFWGILAPWTVCLLVSYWFGFEFVRDAELGASGTAEDDDA